MLAASLAACMTDSEQGGGQGGLVYTDDRGVANQPFPADYRAQLLAFLRTYLNNPAGIRDAAMAGTARTSQAPAAKTATVNSNVLNANAKAKAKSHHHRAHHHHRASKQS